MPIRKSSDGQSVVLGSHGEIRDPQLRAFIRLGGWAFAHGFDLPVQEFCPKLVHDDKVRKWRFDIAWPEYKIAVEVEGGVYTSGRHTRGVGYEMDLRKYNAAALCGWLVFRATPQMLELEWAEFTAILGKAIARTRDFLANVTTLDLDFPRRSDEKT